MSFEKRLRTRPTGVVSKNDMGARRMVLSTSLCRYLRCHAMWVWCGVAWRGVVWCGVVWWCGCGVVVWVWCSAVLKRKNVSVNLGMLPTDRVLTAAMDTMLATVETQEKVVVMAVMGAKA